MKNQTPETARSTNPEGSIGVDSTKKNPDGLRTEKQIPESCQTKPNSNCILTSPTDLDNQTSRKSAITIKVQSNSTRSRNLSLWVIGTQINHEQTYLTKKRIYIYSQIK